MLWICGRVWSMVAPIKWMPSEYFRRLAEEDGLTDQELAEKNAEIMGGKPPSRSAVNMRRKELGIVSRHGTRKNLIPWWPDLSAEDKQHRYLRWLHAEARKREGTYALSKTDIKALDLMHDVLFDRGIQLVIGWHKEIGWYLADRKPSDKDIIRWDGPDDED